MNKVKSNIFVWATKKLQKLDNSSLENFILNLVKERVDSLPSDEALRFLFHLDAKLYVLEGLKSVEYDKGIHTKHRHTRYHDFFIKRLHGNEEILDIGCGNGALTYDIATKTAAHLTGIDINAIYLEVAHKKYSHERISYIQGDALKDLPDHTFDVVILSNVLEHLPERSVFLRKVIEITHPARFLIRVPLFERDWRVPLKKELGVEWRLDSTHETEYTYESFMKEIDEAGLRISYQETRWGEIWAELVADASKS
jgi:2-polyprenyl-3-methyl-5-hydroxy-6-metoxy-1,4-benzoquinol methylase